MTSLGDNFSQLGKSYLDDISYLIKVPDNFVYKE
jgi:hypothetical protein